jgi:hypothetical protein
MLQNNPVSTQCTWDNSVHVYTLIIRKTISLYPNCFSIWTAGGLLKFLWRWTRTVVVSLWLISHQFSYYFFWKLSVVLLTWTIITLQYSPTTLVYSVICLPSSTNYWLCYTTLLKPLGSLYITSPSLQSYVYATWLGIRVLVICITMQ